jgi:cholesterol 7-dehydrogenase
MMQVRAPPNSLIALWLPCALTTPSTEGRDPPYLPPRIKEIDEGKFVYRGKYDALVKMHIQVCSFVLCSLPANIAFNTIPLLSCAHQEFAENSADFQHFDPLHGQMCLPFTLIPIPGMRIIHEAGTLS